MAVLPRDLTVTFEVRPIPITWMEQEYLRAMRISRDDIARVFNVPAQFLDSEPRRTLMGYPILIDHDVDLRLGKFDNVSVGYRVVAGTKLELDSVTAFGDTPFVHPNCRCAVTAQESHQMELDAPKPAAPKKRRTTTAILADLKQVARKRHTIIREGNAIYAKLEGHRIERDRLTVLVADLNAEFNASFNVETDGDPK